MAMVRDLVQSRYSHHCKNDRFGIYGTLLELI
jgi:hypothetical protein